MTRVAPPTPEHITVKVRLEDWFPVRPTASRQQYMSSTSKVSSHIPENNTIRFSDPSEEGSLHLPEMLKVQKSHLAGQDECG